MTTSYRELDKIAMDIISGSMYSLNFLRNISVAISDHRIEDLTVREFYAVWLEKTRNPDHSVPYCLGSIFGYLYCGILLSKERWYDLLPEDSIKNAPSDWGFASANCSSPKNLDPSIKYTIRRIRNALGHGNISISVPPTLGYPKDEFEFEKRTTVRFYDENPRDISDIFEIEMSIESLSMLVRKFHGIAYREIVRDAGDV